MELPQPHHYQSPVRWWLLIVATELALLALLYALFRQGGIFYLIGPFILFNLALWAFPYWYVAFFSAPLYQGAAWKNAKSTLDNFIEQKQLKPTQLLMGTTKMNNVILFAHPFKNWLYVDLHFWQKLSPAEQMTVFESSMQLLANKQARSATLLTGLFFIFPPFKKLFRPRELCFFIDQKNKLWHKLNYKVFYMQQAPDTLFANDFFTPCLLFPSLTVYRHGRYFALHKHLRDMYIACIETKNEVSHGAKN